MKTSLGLGAALLVCAACSSGVLAGPSWDGGGPEAHVVEEAGGEEAGGHEAGVPDDAGPLDGADAPSDATTEAAPVCQLAVPTFSPAGPPPGGATVLVGSSVTILPPPGLPAGGQIFYLTNGAAPTPQNGLLYFAPIQLGFEYGATETVVAIAHDPAGACADSLPAVAYYEADLPDCCANLPPPLIAPTSGTYPGAFLVTITALPGATACYTLDGNPPTCGEGDAAGVCGPGSLTYVAGSPIAIEPNPTSSTITVVATACQPGMTLQGALALQEYTLQLAPTYLASTNAAGAGRPGWDWSGTGAPGTTMPVPADAGLPYGPFQAQQVGDRPCTSATSCTGAPNQLADFLCWSKNAVPTCACSTPMPLTPAAPYATLPASADVQPGDALSVIACQSSPPSNAPGVYAASAVTTVHF